MKKLLLVLAIGAFVACNDNAGTDDATTDSIPTTTPVDTTTAPMDTTTVPMDTTTRPADTTAQ
jgi:hypothetical protein